MRILPYLRTLRRPAGVAALAVVAVAGVAVSNLVTRPASTTSEAPTVQLAQPAADGETTTTTTATTVAPTPATGEADRAEAAATRAETAAGRAETAATKAETIITATTTTTAPITMSQPVGTTTTLADPDPAVAEPTTTTTTAPKRWVEIARFPVAAGTTSSGSALRGTIAVQTGLLRARRIGGCCQETIPFVWFSDQGETSPSYSTDTPDTETGNTILEDYSSGTRWVGWRGPWPAGQRTITVSAYGDWAAAPFTGGNQPGEIVVEEYR